jgi:hypothetical protein
VEGRYAPLAGAGRDADRPVVEYLAYSLSAFYGVMGALWRRSGGDAVVVVRLGGVRGSRVRAATISTWPAPLTGLVSWRIKPRRIPRCEKEDCMKKVNLVDTLPLFTDLWSAKIVGELNGQQVMDLWRQADATAGVTDNANYLRRTVVKSQAHVLGGPGRGADRRLQHRHLRYRGAERVTGVRRAQ